MLFIIIMSNSNTFNNNLDKMSLDDAYRFHTFSSYINNNGLNTMFSSKCIFCPCDISVALTKDGSFRQCKSCKKQFRATLIRK
jgi:hypothetical protein